MFNNSEPWPLYHRNEPQYFIWNGNIRGKIFRDIIRNICNRHVFSNANVPIVRIVLLQKIQQLNVASEVLSKLCTAFSEQVFMTEFYKYM